jgi:hypothetical protein
MMRTLAFCIPLLAIATTAVADDAATLTAAVVGVKKATSGPAAAPARTSASQAKPEDERAGAKPEAAPAGAKPPGDVQMSGMSVLGNDDSPKSLVLVPWKSSQLGDAPGLSKMLDDSTQPVDKDVFMRELGYYEIKIGETQVGDINPDSK